MRCEARARPVVHRRSPWLPVGMFRQAAHGAAATLRRSFRLIFTINLIANNYNVYYNM